MKEQFVINDSESAKDFQSYLKAANPQYKVTPLNDGLHYVDSQYDVLIEPEFSHVIPSEYSNKLIFGKNQTEGIVSIEIIDSKVHIYLQDGSKLVKPMVYWMLANKPLDHHFKRLKGNLHYKYIRCFTTLKAFKQAYGKYRRKDIFQIWNEKEAAMIYYGYTMFKGIKVKDVSVLSFDIEAKGIAHDEESEVFLITNTFRDKNGKITKKHFREDDYKSQQALIDDWCQWVVEQDPMVLNGHNIFGYDLPYLQYCYGDEPLPLGKEGRPVEYDKKTSEFRVDGSQTWEYRKIHVYGRHMLDGAFLAVKYDIGRNYPSWALKAIAEYEGVVKEGRQFYDASKIAENWTDPIEREKIIQYGIDDSDDSLALYDIHIPSIFYMTQSVPKPFQLMGLSASGGQLNAIMVRAYLQDGHSVPKASEKSDVAGGMSYGIPGIYSNVVKWDAASYYPSTILKFGIYDKAKDPKAYYLEMVQYFTEKRFAQKAQYKDTGDTYYNDLQSASKIFINSAYGLLGTNKLNFNSFHNAAKITQYCRKGLQKAIIWATGKDVHEWWSEYVDSKGYEQDVEFADIDHLCEWTVDTMPQHDWKLVNIDTDSLSFCKQDGSAYTKEEYDMIFEEINKIMYSDWEDDGRFDQVLVLKAKNYVLVSDSKIKKKGSSITDSKKEPALQEFLDELIRDFLDTKGENTHDIYHKYVKEANSIDDISRWAVKKSVSKAVLNPTRTNEQKVLDAIQHKSPREGDKFFLYSAIDGEVQKMAKGEPVFYKNGEPNMIPNRVLKCIDENYEIDIKHYTERVYKTLEIVANLLDIDEFLNYTLTRNKKSLETLLES